MSDLDIGPDGSIALAPLLGWTTFTPYGINVGVRLEFFRSAEALEARKPDAVQLIMTAGQADELAQALRRALDKVRTPDGSGSRPQ